MARPKVDIDLVKVEELAARGLTLEKIAYCLDIDPATLYRRKKVLPVLQDAIKRGQAQGERFATDKLFDALADGKPWAICFFLKCKGGWRETQKLDLTSSDGSMSPASNTDAFNLSLLSPEQIRALRGIADEQGKGTD